MNLKGTDPLQSAVLSNLKPVSYKNQLQGQDAVQPKSTGHKVRARNLAQCTHFYISLLLMKTILYPPTKLSKFLKLLESWHRSLLTFIKY